MNGEEWELQDVHFWILVAGSTHPFWIFQGRSGRCSHRSETNQEADESYNVDGSEIRRSPVDMVNIQFFTNVCYIRAG